MQAAELIRTSNQNELPSREAQLLTLENTKEFDVLVIGGGATGSGCALDAVTRGMEHARKCMDLVFYGHFIDIIG